MRWGWRGKFREIKEILARFGLLILDPPGPT